MAVKLLAYYPGKLRRVRYALTTNHSFFGMLLENNEPAIRKSYRKEMLLKTKSEVIAKVYVIENAVFRG